MSKTVKTIFWVLVIGFLLFYLFTNPAGAANAVKTVVGWFAAVITFFVELAR